MAGTSLRREEAFGLALAALGHVALVAVLVLYRPAAPLPRTERITVSLSDVLGPVSTAPSPAAAAAPDTGPEQGDAPLPPAPQPVVPPKVTPKPAPAPAPAQRPAPAKPAPQPKAVAPPNQKPLPGKPGASAFDQAFSRGIPQGSGTAKTKGTPAAKASDQQVASWSSAIGSRVRGPWNSCPVSGLDVNRLRAVVRFTLDQGGRVLTIEEPEITGITDGNRPQVKPFRDCAVRAIKLAAPFTGLPPEFYDQWKNRKLNFRKE